MLTHIHQQTCALGTAVLLAPPQLWRHTRGGGQHPHTLGVCRQPRGSPSEVARCNGRPVGARWSLSDLMHGQQGREGQLPTLREATGVCGAGVDRAELGRRASGYGTGGEHKKGQWSHLSAETTGQGWLAELQGTCALLQPRLVAGQLLCPLKSVSAFQLRAVPWLPQV